jgi:hypothetical protein
MNAVARPWKVASSPAPVVVARVRELSAAWHSELVNRGVYTRDEMDAMEKPMTHPGRECSWAAAPAFMAGPMTLVARFDGEVIAGVELWRQDRDRFWFLEMLIRDQAPAYKGVGAEVAEAAIAWLWGYLKASGERYGVRVHAMTKEEGAVKFWTRLLGRDPDFDDAFQRTADFYFPAVGWIIEATPAQTPRA